jgi:xylulokinase
MDYGSRGAILGLTLNTSAHTLYLALMEGVCYEMRLNMERIQTAGVGIQSLRATGGGANSAVWTQMKADVLGIPITALATSDAGSVGSAMAAGVALGMYKDLEEAAKPFVKERRVFLPRPKQKVLYDEAYRRYLKLYDAVRPLMEETL